MSPVSRAICSGALRLDKAFPVAHGRGASRAARPRVAVGRIAFLSGSFAAALLPWMFVPVRLRPARHAMPRWTIAWAARRAASPRLAGGRLAGPGGARPGSRSLWMAAETARSDRLARPPQAGRDREKR
ncbi:MAG TPA: hypothetical protein VKV80_19905 [Streptosporangiaceae bacterium]|nr:hypothetical protein [Streptosporangiaceae bacterium]